MQSVLSGSTMHVKRMITIQQHEQSPYYESFGALFISGGASTRLTVISVQDSRFLLLQSEVVRRVNVRSVFHQFLQQATWNSYAVQPRWQIPTPSFRMSEYVPTTTRRGCFADSRGVDGSLFGD